MTFPRLKLLLAVAMGAALSSAWLIPAGSSATGGELVANGTLEADPGAAWAGSGPCSFVWTGDRAYSGAHALRIVSGTTELCRWLTPTAGTAAVAVQPGRAYDISAWLLADRASAGVTLSANFWTAGGAYIPATVDGALERTPLVWMRSGMRVTAPAGAAVVRVELRLVGAGTLWADDVSVREAGTQVPPPPVTILGAEPGSVAGSGTSVLTWRHDDTGSYSVRVGGSTCSDGLQVDAGTSSVAPETLTSLVPGTALAPGENTVRVCFTNANGTGEAATTIEKVAPSPVGSTLAGTVAIGAGDGHSCAVGAGGTVRCWGDDTWGQLGDGAPARQQSVPVEVVGLPAGTVAVAGGWAFTCALGGDGRVRCWGENSRGQLGDGSTTSSSTPVEVQGMHDVVAIAAGSAFACALTRTGDVACWGANDGGELGDGTTVDRPLPDWVNQLAGIVAIDAGIAHACAVTSAGAVLCWGADSHGDLGDGSGERRLVPVQVQGLGQGAGVTAVGAGGFHTCAIAAGRVLCWGENAGSQLGDGSAEDGSVPVAVRNDAGVASISGATALAVSGSGACVVVAGGDVRCWGTGLDGQLGNGGSFSSAGPEAVRGLDGPAVALAAGFAHACALLRDGRLDCWGWNAYGQVGDGSTANRNVAVPVLAPSARSAANLAPDPGFEGDPTPGWYWAGSGSFDQLGSTSHSPALALHILSAQPAGLMSRWMTRIPAIPVTPGHGYDVAAWLSGTAPAGGLQLVVTFWGPGEGSIPGSAYHAGALLGSVPWTKTALYAVAPPGAASLRVELRLLGPGELWADDVEVIAR